MTLQHGQQGVVLGQNYRAPQYPHVNWSAVRDAYGRIFIHFSCSKCGDKTTKQCSNKDRAPHWASRYLVFHTH